MHHSLSTLAQQFQLLKLHVTVQLQKDTELPSFKGSMLHGWFGHALKAADDRAYNICYGTHDEQQPKPYMISPSLDHKTEWKKGELFEFDITLFGDAVNLVDQIFQALHIGEKLGFGVKRSPFKVISVASHTAQGLKIGVQVTKLSDWLHDHSQPSLIEEKQEVTITLQTPVRVKHNGEIVKSEVNDTAFWVNSILRRLKQLSQYWVVDSPELFDAVYNETRISQNIEVTSHCYFEDWQRFSLKQKEQLPFGGLKGQMSFYGDLETILPILKIGELIHVGGKTTFGLGKLKLIS